MRFKIWFENNEQPALPPQKEEELKRAFDTALTALAGNVKPEAGLKRSLSDLKSGDTEGRAAADKLLAQVYQSIENIGDPNLIGNIEVVRHWLDDELPANADKTVAGLLEKLFGVDNFGKYAGSDASKPDQAKAQVEPQPPKPQAPTPNNSMDQNTPQPPMPQQPNGMQPQANGMPQPPAPTVPMPPAPAGSFMGLY